MSESTTAKNRKQEIDTFLHNWSDTSTATKVRLIDFISYLEKRDGVFFDFVARPGVSYSIRPFRLEQQEQGRNLFAMIDVIDDEPGQRWLSICFYEDMIEDPEERGEIIPGGLSGDDGYCFDMFEDDAVIAEYLKKRLDEAAEAAKK